MLGFGNKLYVYKIQEAGMSRKFVLECGGKFSWIGRM